MVKTADSLVPTETLANEYDWFIRQSHAPRLRTMREFVEQEIVVPDGPFPNQRFKCSRQPYSRLWFDAVDSGKWSEFIATGPTQSGKTLSCFIAPLFYHLFEIGETVICGLPDMDMAGDKWREDIKPIMACSRFRDLIPTEGSGSRGGSKIESVTFKNGATLKFMSGGGSDKSRAGFTSRVVVITEVDGLDVQGQTSREADKVKQIEARTRAFGDRRRIYKECTVSIDTGHTWKRYTEGTESFIATPCPHCHQHVTLERPDLVGWKGTPDQFTAGDESSFFCSSCGEAWSEGDRRVANELAVLLHKGQTIDADGKIAGDLPRTDTLGFRWSASNNMFTTAESLGRQEWRASRESDEDNAEKEMLQFVWCKPHKPIGEEFERLNPAEIFRRQIKYSAGIVPEGTDYITAAADVGDQWLYWSAIAWQKDGTSHILNYGKLEVETKVYGREIAIRAALEKLGDQFEAGWQQGEFTRSPDQVWIDAGYMSHIVDAFVRSRNRNLYRPIMGYGTGQDRRLTYNPKKKTGGQVRKIGDGYHISFMPARRVNLVEIDANQWKAWLHARIDQKDHSGEGKTRGGMSVFLHADGEGGHANFRKHLTNEQREKTVHPTRGEVITFTNTTRRVNHWFDATYINCAAGHFCGVRLIDEPKPAPRPETPDRGPLLTPSGQPFLITER